jgi:hypothetical protein
LLQVAKQHKHLSLLVVVAVAVQDLMVAAEEELEE